MAVADDFEMVAMAVMMPDVMINVTEAEVVSAVVLAEVAQAQSDGISILVESQVGRLMM